MYRNEFPPNEYSKNLKAFANERQVKHTSTIIETSILFHTIVKLVDSEDRADDRIRTLALTSELNNITNQLQSQIIEQPTEQHLLTQTKDPNKKTNMLTKNTAPTVTKTNHLISSCFKKTSRS